VELLVMAGFSCDYAPGCQATFNRKSRKDDHVLKAHGGPGKLFCSECAGDLRFFQSAKSLATHVRNVHVRVQCAHCRKWMQPKNMSRHLRSCQPADADEEDAGLETEEKTDQVIPYEQEPVFHSQQDPDVRRAPHRAPSREIVDRRMNAFLDWYKDENSLGRYQRGINSDDFASKFGTVLGKMSAHFELTEDQVLRKLNSGEAQLAQFLTAEKVDSLMRFMGKGVDGNPLHL
jgi:hypothetical protein